MTKTLQTSEKELWKEYKRTNNPKIKELLTRQYLPLVKHIVKKFIKNNRPVDPEDMFSYGLEGLLDAVERFDISKNIKFTTYAFRRVIGGIHDGIREEDIMPRSFRVKEKQYNILKEKLGRTPTRTEIKEELSLKEKPLEAFLRMLDYRFLNLDVYIDEEEQKRRLRDIIPAPDEYNPDKLYVRKEIQQKVSDAVKKLSRRSRKLIILYYYESLTLKEIGEVMGVTEARASQIRKQADSELKEEIKHMEVYV